MMDHTHIWDSYIIDGSASKAMKHSKSLYSQSEKKKNNCIF